MQYKSTKTIIVCLGLLDFIKNNIADYNIIIDICAQLNETDIKFKHDIL